MCTKRESAAEHDARLMKALKRIEEAGVTLNESKCQFGKTRIQFLGHVIDENGISADPEKVSALVQMKSPENISELRRFMGMANQLGKFSSRLAELSQPLRVLLSTKNEWNWGPEQDQAFRAVKEELAKPTILGLYSPAAKTKVSLQRGCVCGCIVIDLKNLSRLDPYSKIYVKRCDILDIRGLLLALTSHSRAKLGRMGGFQTVEGVRTFHAFTSVAV